MVVLNPNISNLERAAEALEPLLPDLMFVGGTLTGLFVTDPAAGTIRGTKDVDVVAEFAEAQGYAWVCSRVRSLGFHPDSREGAPVCRWVREALVVDLLGTAPTSFGPTNPWYAEGFTHRVPHTLSNGLTIQTLPTHAWMLAKWEAFLGRGRGDMVGSHDIEDLMTVLDGRLERDLERDLLQASPMIRHGLGHMARALLASQQFLDYALGSLGDRKNRAQRLLEQYAKG